MAEFHFIRPEMLFALLPLALIWWLLWRGQNTFRQMQKIVDPHLLEHLVVDHSRSKTFTPLHLLAIIWFFSVIAVAGPSWEKESAPFAEDNAGLYVLLKLNKTMNSTDVQPSRLERAKQKIGDLLKQRQQLSTALIVYSASSHLVMPLTRDDTILTKILEDITPDIMPVEGDMLTQALLMAEKSAERAGAAASILVITDSVADSQVKLLSTHNFSLPVQFLVMHSPAIELDKGIESAASLIGASVTRLSVDKSDINRIASRAKNNIQSVSDISSGVRWRDAGYYLMFFIGVFAISWSRKGWIVR
jgi:Ca-activated chloride channel family protein